MNNILNNPKIMVVTECMQTLDSICEYLVKMEIQPLIAKYGSEAIEIYCKEFPDIVLLDDQLTDMSAYSIAKKIRSLEKISDWTAIIFISSKFSNDDLSLCINSGGNDCLLKPVNYFSLKYKIMSMQHLIELKNKLLDLTHCINSSNNVLRYILHPDKL